MAHRCPIGDHYSKPKIFRQEFASFWFHLHVNAAEVFASFDSIGNDEGFAIGKDESPNIKGTRFSDGAREQARFQFSISTRSQIRLLKRGALVSVRQVSHEETIGRRKVVTLWVGCLEQNDRGTSIDNALERGAKETARLYHALILYMSSLVFYRKTLMAEK